MPTDSPNGGTCPFREWRLTRRQSAMSVKTLRKWLHTSVLCRPAPSQRRPGCHDRCSSRSAAEDGTQLALKVLDWSLRIRSCAEDSPSRGAGGHAKKPARFPLAEHSPPVFPRAPRRWLWRRSTWRQPHARPVTLPTPPSSTLRSALWLPSLDEGGDRAPDRRCA